MHFYFIQLLKIVKMEFTFCATIGKLRIVRHVYNLSFVIISKKKKCIQKFMSRCTITVVIHCFVYQVSLQKIPLEMASSQEKWNIRKQISFSFKRHSICCLAQLIWIQFTTDLCIMNMQGGQVNYVICGSSWQWVELKSAFGVFCMIQLCDWWNFLNSITSNVVFHPKFLS